MITLLFNYVYDKQLAKKNMVKIQTKEIALFNQLN